MHDHDCLRWLAGLIVDRNEIVECGLGNDAESGPEPECVLSSPRDYTIHHTHVDDIRQIVTRRSLAGSEADRTGIAANYCANTGGVHLFHFSIAAVGR